MFHSIAMTRLFLFVTATVWSSVAGFVPKLQRPIFTHALSSMEEENIQGDSLLESLKARQSELVRDRMRKEQKWRNADCSSGIKLAIPDWVRRLDVEYPLAACGSSSGAVFVANLETGHNVATNVAHNDDEDDTLVISNPKTPSGLDSVLRLLYGSYDGGGTLAIAFAGDLIATSNREGSVELWRLGVSSQKLVPQGTMKCLDGILVTCLHLDEDYLWVGTANGNLQAYPLESTLPLALQHEAELEWNFPSALLSLSMCPDIGCGVATTANGSVELVSTEEDGRAICSFYPPFDSGDRRSSPAYGMSAILVSHGNVEEGYSYSIACGGSDGSLWLQSLRITEDGEVDEDQPFFEPVRQMRPPHLGPIKCLASPLPGLLISGGLDGCMRVWDVKEASSLYQFVGYKVWMGSLWTDGSRIVSDGSDNSVVMHDFDKEEEDL
jgi:WD40 repeat protein